MNSIRIHQFGGPQVLQLESLSDPLPGPDEVVVITSAIGVNPVDTYIRAGKYGPKAFPFTPGTDAAGTISAIGTNIKTVKAGQRVYIYGALDGAYSDRVRCRIDQVYPLPDRLSFDQGAAIGVPYGTAYRALFIRGNAKPNETVLIHGASGGVGTAAVQLAVNYGCRVFGTAGTPAGLELVKSLGASQVFDHRSDNYSSKILEATGGVGVDMIIEMLADKNLDKDLALLAKRGRVVVIGNRGRIEIDPRQMMAKDSDIRGMSLAHADAAELAMIHAALGAAFSNGSLTPIVGNHFSLADAAKAHEAVMEPGSQGKIVLRV